MILRRALAGWIGATLFALTQAAAWAQISAGSEFTEINPAVPVSTGSKIEVLEFFYYGCPICYELQPQMSRWLVQAPDYVALKRVPALSSENWENFAKLYYSLEVLGQIGRLHWPVYDNFHFDGVLLNDEKVMIKWVAKNRIDPEKFTETYHSAEVLERVAKAREMMKTYDVRGVPTIVVDGKYLSSARLAGGTKELMRVVDQLVRRARKERPQ